MRSKLLPAILIAGLLATACARATPAAAPTPSSAASVAITPATTGTIDQTLSATGNVVAADQVSVVPKQSGQIVTMPVDVGTKVKAGDLIAQLDHASLDLNVENAQAQLAAAQVKLDTIKVGPRPENVQESALNVSTAQSKLQAMLNGPQPATITQAQASVDSAQQKLAAMQAGGTPTSVAQAQAGLDVALAKQQALKNGLTSGQIASLRLAVSQAKDSLYAAQVSRDATCGFKGPMCNAANASVDAAQTAVDEAQQNIATQTAPPTQTDLQQAQAAVNQSQAALTAAQKPYTPQDLKQAQDAVTQAQAALTLSQHPYTDQDIAQARDAVAVAEQQLALAKQPYTAQDLQSAVVGVSQAQVGVDQARKAVADTTVTAPVDGVITQKALSQGDIASTSASLVTIASAALKVQIPIEEGQVVNVKLGQPATISGAALGSTVVPAKITNIAPSGSTTSRTFTADVTPDQSSDLLAGMFVKVTLNTLEHRNVTVIPTPALVQRDNQTYVFVVQNGIAHQTTVQLGLSNAQFTEIVSGVTPGTNVIVQGQDNLSDGDRVTVIAAQPTAT